MHILTEHQIRRNRRRLSLLILLLLIPFFLAWLMVRFEIWLPSETINKGEFIQESDPFYHWPWQSQSGFPTDLKQRWLLVLVNQEDCQGTCTQWQHQLQQIHKALGKEGKRVRRVFLQSDIISSPLPDTLEGMGAQVIRQWHGLTLSTSDWQKKNWLGQDYQVLLIDPVGNLVTGYAADHSGRDLLKDLRRLLRASSAG